MGEQSPIEAGRKAGSSVYESHKAELRGIGLLKIAVVLVLSAIVTIAAVLLGVKNNGGE